MFSTVAPFPQYFDNDGRPLDSGYLYYGTAGQNPETSPITVYWDSAGTQPAAQPIRTKNGFAMRNGAPAMVFVNSDYSLTVRDKRRRLLYYAQNSADYTSYAAVQAGLAASTGAGLVGWIQAGAGAVFRWVRDKLRERVSVEDFGAVGDGVADDTVAITAALSSFGANPGTLVFTKPFYRISGTLLVQLSGMRLVGISSLGCYLLTADGQTFDLMRIAGSNVEVTGFNFRPGNGAQLCLNVYAARAHIHHNRFLAGNPGSNTAILLKSDTPTGTPVPGAYNHLVEFNEIGIGGYHFAIGIDQDGSLGQQANMIFKNKIIGNLCVKTRVGGGNTYTGNLLQSQTGTVGAPAGNGFDFDPGVVGETVQGNYIERFQYGIISRNNTAYSGGFFGPNHNDNNTNNVYFLTKGNSFYMDSQDGVLRLNEWQILPAWNSNWRLKSGFYANTSIEVKSAINSVQLNGMGLTYETRSQATGSTVDPSVGGIRLRGNGAPATNITLQAGYYDGQELSLIGDSWSAQLATTNCTFSSAGAPTFGNSAGNVAAMLLTWMAGEGKWYEQSRVVR